MKRSLRDTRHARGWMQGNEKRRRERDECAGKKQGDTYELAVWMQSLEIGCFAAAPRVTCAPS
jgi:hypothetical protein